MIEDMRWFGSVVTESSQYLWIVQVFLIIFIALLANYVANRSFGRIEQRLKLTRNLWDDALFYALKKPVSIFIWVIGVALAAQVAEQAVGTSLVDIVLPLRDVSVIVLLAWALIRFISHVEINILQTGSAQKKKLDATTVHAVSKLLRISVLITASLVILQFFGYSVSGVLAFGGIGGIAVGFAARDLLANFFGGLMLYLDRPFAVGDWVRSPDRDIEGVVEEIGWRLTHIRTFDKRPLYVPNSVFAQIAVENPSRMSHRRIKEVIGIRYDDASKIQGIVASVKNMLIEHPEIDSGQTLIVNFDSFAPSSLDFFVYTFTKTTNWIRFHEVKQDVLLKILSIVEEYEAEVAFPTSTVHVLRG